MKKIRVPQDRYSLYELIKWIPKYIKLNTKNHGKVQFISKNCVLNEINEKYRITFLGDIMDLGHRYFKVNNSFKTFIKDSDFLVGNFEAVITKKKPIFHDQVHDMKTLDSLKDIFPPSKTYLSLANNHAGDFGKESFEKSVQIIEDAGFNVFGKSNSPYIDLNPDIRIITGTMWTNKPFDQISFIRNFKRDFLKPNAMNIFYPHWGYEMETYPRASYVRLVKKIIPYFGAIIGHHSHSPQPINSLYSKEQGIQKLCAYSLGDVCFGKKLKKHFYNLNHGLILKTEIGTTTNGHWAIGKVKWEFIECFLINPGMMLVAIMKSNPYFPHVKD